MNNTLANEFLVRDNSSARSARRILELEGIRGTLSLIVLLGHVDYRVMPWFWGAMEFFFVISGYLIADIIFRNASASNFYTTYFCRRSLRIWPLYFVVLIACCTLTVLRNWFAPSSGLLIWPSLVMCLTFTQNLEQLPTLLGTGDHSYAGYPMGFGHTWSVAVEEQFYVLAAFLLPLMVNRRGLLRTSSVLFLLSAMILSMLLRILGMHDALLISRSDGFVLGVLLAALFRGQSFLVSPTLADLAAPLCQKRLIVWAAGLGGTIAGLYVVIAYFIEDDFPHWGHGPSPVTSIRALALSGFAVLALGVIGFVVRHAGSHATRGLRAPWLVHLGKISYSTYLWHPPLFVFAQFTLPRYLSVPPEYVLLITAPVALAVSHLSYSLIEAPFLRLGRRLEYRSVGEVSGGCSPIRTAP